MYNGIFDTHAHYDHELFNFIRHAILSGLPELGVSLVLNCGSNIESSTFSATLADEYSYVYSAAGIHPHDASRVNENWQEDLIELLSMPKTVALGEIGLDYHYNFSEPFKQREIFAKSLEIAVSLDMPVVVHDRDAHEDILTMLKEYNPKGVVHRFSGSVKMLEQLIDLGFYLGFGCSVIYENSINERKAVSVIPIERLLLETDCPYLPPPTNKNEICRSDMLTYAAQTIAEIRPEYKTKQIIDISRENGMKLFSIQQH